MKINKLAIAVMTMALVVITPVTAQAKTKTVSFDIDKVSANEFVQTVQSKGKSAHFTERDKNTYPIKITVKAKNKKDGRAKVKAFAKKVQKAKDNTYGLSYGVQYDDYNTDSFSNGVYTTNLFSTCNDIYFLNGITAKALKQEAISTYKIEDGWSLPVGAYTKNLFPETKDFKNSSDSVKAQVILDYLNYYCMIGDTSVKTPCTWKELYNETARGACGVYMRMNIQALRMIAIDYQAEEEINLSVRHGVALLAVKNSKGTYDYFINSSNFYINPTIEYTKLDTFDLVSWMEVEPESFKYTKIQKAAYNYGKKGTRSELDKMILEYHK